MALFVHHINSQLLLAERSTKIEPVLEQMGRKGAEASPSVEERCVRYAYSFPLGSSR